MSPRNPAIALLALGFHTVDAAEISKANSTLDVALGGSWINGTAPGPNDVAMWDYQFAQSLSSAITTDISWGGIKLNKWASKKCQISAPSPVITELSIGSSGIVSTKEVATENVIQLATDLVCTADQSWSAIAGMGGQLIISGAPRYDEDVLATANYLDLGGHTVTVDNLSVRVSGNTPSDMILRNGNLVLNNSTLRVSSSGRWKSTVPIPIFTVPSDLSIQLNSGSELILWDSYISSENLSWNAAVTLNGGNLQASAPGVGLIGIPGSSRSNPNTVAGTISVTADSVISLSSEIGVPSEGEVVHRITAPISGSANLSIKNESGENADNLIAFAGDNAGFSGAIGVVGDEGKRTLRLTSDSAGSAAARWTIGGSNTLEIENSEVSLGALSGGGTLIAIGGGESSASIGGGSFTGTITQQTGSTLHFRKVGTTTHTYRGSEGWNGNTSVDEGTLSLTKPSLDADTTVEIAAGAFLRLSHGKTDGVEALFIDGVAQSNGIWGAIDSGAEFESASITGSGRLLVTGSEPYAKWIGDYPDLEAADRAPEADPDHSSLSNLGEFAFAGDPTDASNEGGPFETALDPDFRFVLPVRAGAVFSNTGGEMVSAPIDGIIYRIQASLDLINFTTVVLETPAFIPDAGAPPLPAGWEYRSFETDLIAEDTPRQFIRAAAEAAP